MNRPTITCHARKRPSGTWTGYVRVTSDGPRPWTESTLILRNNRVDALADAHVLRTDILRQNGYQAD